MPPVMQRRADPVDKPLHRKIAADLFNYTWTLLERTDRSAEEDAEMIHSAHASLYHWRHAGGAVNFSIGEWQISRVYSVLGHAEPARYHAQRALEFAERKRVGRFYLAYAREACARAAAVAGDRPQRNQHLRAAKRISASVRELRARRMLLADLATIP